MCVVHIQTMTFKMSSCGRSWLRIKLINLLVVTKSLFYSLSASVYCDVSCCYLFRRHDLNSAQLVTSPTVPVMLSQFLLKMTDWRLLLLLPTWVGYFLTAWRELVLLVVLLYLDNMNNCVQLTMFWCNVKEVPLSENGLHLNISCNVTWLTL